VESSYLHIIRIRTTYVCQAAFRPWFYEEANTGAIKNKRTIQAATDNLQRYERMMKFLLFFVTFHQFFLLRPNLYLEVKSRPPSTSGAEESIDAVIHPILAELRKQGVNFPRTLIYLPLQWCGYVHHAAVSKYLQDHPDEVTIQDADSSRLTCLVSQFHAPQSQGVSGSHEYDKSLLLL
jgi:hypothetical protein